MKREAGTTSGNDMPASAVLAGPGAPPVSLVSDADTLGRLLAALEGEPAVGLDTETTGLDPRRDELRCVQLATGAAAWVVDARAVPDLSSLRAWLSHRARPGRRTLLHNGAFDLGFLRARLGGRPLDQVAVSDTMIWSELLACGLPVPGGHTLGAAAERWLGLRLPKEEQRGDWSGELSREKVEYAGRDAWVLVPLAAAMWQGTASRRGLVAEGLERVAQVEDSCVPVVADLQYDGIGFDLGYWGQVVGELEVAVGQAADTAQGLLAPPGAGARLIRRSLFGVDSKVIGGVNLDSPLQVQAALARLGVKVPGTADDVLRPLAEQEPAVAAVLGYRRQAKLLSAFGLALPRHVHPLTGRIHAQYRQVLRGGLGRMSCARPNIQQIPHEPRLRRAFVPAAGNRLVIADLSQIELRIMAKLSGDARMLAAYRQGEDLHRLTASLITGTPLSAVTPKERQLSKAINFGLIYGMGAGGLRTYAANTYGVRMSEADAETFRRRFFAAYPGVAAFHRRQDTEARRARETRTLLGRCQRWSDGDMGLPELANSPDQGSGGDVLKLAMARLRPDLLRTGAMLVAAVHDELVVECPADRGQEVAEAVRSALVEAGRELLDPVPVAADVAVGESWADKA